MEPLVGKIAYDVPTPGGDLGVWDTVLNENTFVQMAEDLFASRDNQNLVVYQAAGQRSNLGLGWNPSTGAFYVPQLYIRDLWTTEVLQVDNGTVTLANVGDFVYIKKPRMPAAGLPQLVKFQTLAGDAPFGKDDHDIVCLAIRVENDCVYLPLTNTIYNQGPVHFEANAITHYEAVAARQTWSFHVSEATPTLVKFPASDRGQILATMINGMPRVFDTEQVIDYATKGVWGTRPGFPGEWPGTGEDPADDSWWHIITAADHPYDSNHNGFWMYLTRSMNPIWPGFTPSAPAGHYLGTIRSGTGGNLLPFSSCQGRYIYHDPIQTILKTTSGQTTYTLEVPPTADLALLRIMNRKDGEGLDRQYEVRFQSGGSPYFWNDRGGQDRQFVNMIEYPLDRGIVDPPQIVLYNDDAAQEVTVDVMGYVINEGRWRQGR